MKIDVMGLGTVVVDHLVVLPGTAENDTKTVVLEDRFQVGGPVPTALVLLQRFGWSCSFIGAWADDPFGAMIEADFRREGLDYRLSVAGGVARSGFAHVWVDSQTGARTIACYRPPEGIAPGVLDEALLSGVKALHLDGWPDQTAMEAARIVRRHGGVVVLDTGSPKPNMEELLHGVDVVNCPRRFINQFFETDDLHKGVAALLAMGPRLATVTSGAQGAMIATADGILSRPAYAIEAAADTTGAGDVFCGALIHGVLAQWRPEKMLNFAMAAAAAKCRQIGNRAALPSRDEIRGLMAAPVAAKTAAQETHHI